MPYGGVPLNADGLYMSNQIAVRSHHGTGSEYILSFLTYQTFHSTTPVLHWGVRTKDNDPPANGCYTGIRELGVVYYGGSKDWTRSGFQVGVFVPGPADEIGVMIGAVDMCRVWCGVQGTGACHSHAPFWTRSESSRRDVRPQFTQRDIDMWQDNFEEGGISASMRAATWPRTSSGPSRVWCPATRSNRRRQSGGQRRFRG
jgi:hypothetical protein